MLELLGPWAEVRAMAAGLVHDVETEDLSTALVRFASGALATVVNSAVSPDQVSRIRIDCERATVELTHLYGHSNGDWRITPAPGVSAAELAGWRDMGEDVPSSHLPQLRALLADMRAGRRPRASGDDGRTGLELVTALYKAGQDANEESDHLSLFTELRVRGVRVTPADPAGRSLEVLRRQDIPYVLVDRVSATADACSVSVDDVTGGRLAAQRLLDAGHESIVYVGGQADVPQVRDRRAGALAALAAAGMPPSALVDVTTRRLDVAAGRDAGARLLGLAPRPTAVFCTNDLLTLGVLQSLFDAGVKVLGQVAIVGYDDIEFAAAAAVPLTSVRQPAAEMGRIAMELLAAQTAAADGPHEHRQIVLKPNSSSAAPACADATAWPATAVRRPAAAPRPPPRRRAALPAAPPPVHPPGAPVAPRSPAPAGRWRNWTAG